MSCWLFWRWNSRINITEQLLDTSSSFWDLVRSMIISLSYHQPFTVSPFCQRRWEKNHNTLIKELNRCLIYAYACATIIFLVNWTELNWDPSIRIVSHSNTVLKQDTYKKYPLIGLLGSKRHLSERWEKGLIHPHNIRRTHEYWLAVSAFIDIHLPTKWNSSKKKAQLHPT